VVLSESWNMGSGKNGDDWNREDPPKEIFSKP